VSDDISLDDDFSENRDIWWAGIAFASFITFEVIGWVLISGTYVLNEMDFLEISYWIPSLGTAMLTGIMVTVAVKRGKVKHEPQ
jgi:hypothetical protein